jgi:hypothetical protein
MKTLNTKVALSALAIVAVLSSPALAKSHHQASQDNSAATYNVAPGNEIAGYDSEGGVVGVANPDQYGLQSQR